MLKLRRLGHVIFGGIKAFEENKLIKNKSKGGGVDYEFDENGNVIFTSRMLVLVYNKN